VALQISVRQEAISVSTARRHVRLVGADDAAFWPAWNAFLEAYPLYTYRYEQAVLEYNRMLSGPETVDLSFVVLGDKLPLAICPLVVGAADGLSQASFSRSCLPVPLLYPRLSEKQRRGLEKVVFEEAVRRLRDCGARRWLVEGEVMSLGTDMIEDQLFARFGALDVSSFCHVMDLTLPDEQFWLQIRHSARSTINKGLRTYEFKVYDRSDYSHEVGERHRLLHHKCSGRITRPIKTFHNMYSWVDAGCGLMFEQLHEGQTVQMIFVALGKGTACGASAADDSDFEPPVPLTHSMNYFMYQETARRGIRYYEVGETAWRDSIYAIYTPKEKSICDFKRGFGEQTLPLKRWIWFDRHEDEIRFLEEQLAKYKEHLRGDGREGNH